MEIGSFLELQLPKGREWYKGDKDIARLNTGRMGIWHAFRVTGCKRIWIPIYQCDSIRETFEKKGVEMCFYHQDRDFNPVDVQAKNDDAVLVVNYYGIMSSERMAELAKPMAKNDYGKYHSYSLCIRIAKGRKCSKSKNSPNSQNN